MKVVCRNSATGRAITFDYGDVVFLQDVEDIGTADYTNETSKNTGVNGVTVEGESQDERHPIIRAVVMSDYDVIRDQLDAVFQKGVDGTLMVYRDDGSCRVATYRPEGWELPPTGIVRDLTVKLLCADPLFYDPEEAFTTMAAWRSLFKFPLTFHSPFKISEHVTNLLATIVNPSSAAQALRIVFTATGEVENPYLTDVKRQKTLKIGTDGKPFDMHNGDKIVATTSRNNMHIMLTRGGVETEITNRAAWPVRWLQLQPGENLYRYGAATGEQSLQVQIWHRQSYGGA
ncbi:MAG: phage tail family protein [Subdoligranulum variabile]|nr:phage tail family protein [Subdoligranulum variabile]